MDVDMKSVTLKSNATIKAMDLVLIFWIINRYDKINGYNFEKCNAMIYQQTKFRKIITTIKSTDIILKNVTLW